MFSSIDKAIVAILSGIVFVAAQFGLDLPVSESVISAIGTVVTAVLVYFAPNKQQPGAAPS